MPATIFKDMEIINDTAHRIAAGNVQKDIAKDLGISEGTISKFKEKHAALIDKYAEEYIKAIPIIVQQDLEEIKNSAEVSKDLYCLLKEESQIVEVETKSGDKIALELFQDKRVNALQKYLDYTAKMRTDIKKSIGISTSHAPAMIFQQMNIYNQNQQVISNTVLGALSDHMRNSAELPDDIVIDVDNVDNNCKE